MTADRPPDAVLVPPRASQVERPGDPSFLPVVPLAGDVSSTVTMPSSAAPGTTPAVRPAATANPKESAASPPAPPTARPAGNEPRPDQIDSQAAAAPGPPSVYAAGRSRARERSGRARPVAARDGLCGRLACRRPRAGDAPRREVRIGRIEILPPPAAAVPPAAPRRQPRGFATGTSSRRYRDRRWY